MHAFTLDITGTNAGTTSLQLRSGNNSGGINSNQITFSYNGTFAYQHAIKTRHNSGNTSSNAIDFYVWNPLTDSVGTVGSNRVLTIEGNGKGRVGIGTANPDTTLHVVGAIKMVDGNQGVGKVLTSDANGLASWQNSPLLSTWNLTGNNGTTPGANFIGTTDNTALVIKTNNVEQIRLSASGNLGIGTTTPSATLSFSGNADRTIRMERSTSNDGADLIVQAAGAQSGQLDRNGGDLILSGGIATGNGSSLSQGGSAVIFRTATPLGSSASSDVTPDEKMRIAGNGNVGIGISTPDAPLSIRANGLTFGIYPGKQGNTVNPAYTTLDMPNTQTLYVWDNFEVSGNASKPGGGSWVATSDARLKQDVTPYTDGLTSILSIKPVRYRYNETSGFDTQMQYIGVLAQDVKEVAPYMIGTFEKDGKQYYNVDNSAMTYMLINGMKEQQQMIEYLKKEIEELKKR